VNIEIDFSEEREIDEIEINFSDNGDTVIHFASRSGDLVLIFSYEVEQEFLKKIMHHCLSLKEETISDTENRIASLFEQCREK
jgi:hypothetical protein